LKYTEAFADLGYTLINFRWAWSASSDNGVCISLWRDEIVWAERPFFGTRDHGQPEHLWNGKIGSKFLIQDLTRAQTEFDGWVDVVVREGGPSDRGTVASTPWRVSERNGLKWRVLRVESSTGHYSVETQVAP